LSEQQKAAAQRPFVCLTLGEKSTFPLNALSLVIQKSVIASADPAFALEGDGATWDLL
jgi:hypothetical protein